MANYYYIYYRNIHTSLHSPKINFPVKSLNIYHIKLFQMNISDINQIDSFCVM
jgi:hypothetical protein